MTTASILAAVIRYGRKRNTAVAAVLVVDLLHPAAFLAVGLRLGLTKPRNTNPRNTKNMACADDCRSPPKKNVTTIDHKSK